MAAAASSADARRAHLELALRYETMAAALGPGGSPGGALLSARPSDGPSTDDRSELRKVIASAFPLPQSGAFADLLQAIE